MKAKILHVCALTFQERLLHSKTYGSYLRIQVRQADFRQAELVEKSPGRRGLLSQKAFSEVSTQLETYCVCWMMQDSKDLKELLHTDCRLWAREVLSECVLAWAQPVEDSKADWPAIDWQSCCSLWVRLKRDGKVFLGSLNMSIYEWLVSVCKD